MTEEKKHIEPDYQVEDDRFDVSQITDSELIVESAPYFFRIAVKDGQGYFRVLENYPLTRRYPSEDWLRELFESHKFLSARFWKNIKWLIHSESKTRVPAIIGTERAADILRVLTPHFGEGDEALIDKDLVFAVNADLRNFLENFYTGKTIEWLTADHFLSKNFDEPVLVFYLNGYGYYDKANTYFSGQIENIYPLLNKEKLTYVFGEVTKYDRVFRAMEHEYKVNMGARQAHQLKLSQYFSETPVHRYFCILSQ